MSKYINPICAFYIYCLHIPQSNYSLSLLPLLLLNKGKYTLNINPSNHISSNYRRENIINTAPTRECKLYRVRSLNCLSKNLEQCQTHKEEPNKHLRKEGRREGEREGGRKGGKEEGRKEGRKKGRERGREGGRMEGRKVFFTPIVE